MPLITTPKRNIYEMFNMPINLSIQLKKQIYSFVLTFLVTEERSVVQYQMLDYQYRSLREARRCADRIMQDASPNSTRTKSKSMRCKPGSVATVLLGRTIALVMFLARETILSLVISTLDWQQWFLMRNIIFDLYPRSSIK